MTIIYVLTNKDGDWYNSGFYDKEKAIEAAIELEKEFEEEVDWCECEKEEIPGWVYLN